MAMYTTTAAEFGDFDISPSAANIVNMVLTDSPLQSAAGQSTGAVMADPLFIMRLSQQQAQGPQSPPLGLPAAQQGHQQQLHQPLPNAAVRPTVSGISSNAFVDDDVFDLPPPPDMQAGDEPLTDLERSNLYVSNVSTDVDDDEFKTLFSTFGNILNSRIMVDIHTCKSRGFGFVQFSNPSEAAKAVRAMDGTVHRSQTLMVRLASRKTRQPGQLTAKMFVRNVPAGISEDEVRRYCSRFGAVQNCAVRPDMQHGVVTDTNTGGVSQVAYITFVEVDATKKAALNLNNTKPWPSCVHPLLAKVLDSNQKRRTKEEEAVHVSGGSNFGAGQPGSAGSSTTNPRTGQALMESPGFNDSRNSQATVQAQQVMQPMPLLSPAAVPAATMMLSNGSLTNGGIGPTYITHQVASPPPQQQGQYAQATYLTPQPMHQGQAPQGYQIVMQPTLQPIYGNAPPHGMAYAGLMPQAAPQQQQQAHALYPTPPGLMGTPHGALVGTPQGMMGTPQGMMGTPQGLMGTPQGLMATPQWAAAPQPQQQQVYLMQHQAAQQGNIVVGPRPGVVRHNPFANM